MHIVIFWIAWPLQLIDDFSKLDTAKKKKKKKNLPCSHWTAEVPEADILNQCASLNNEYQTVVS
jgi:hypothetical protein